MHQPRDNTPETSANAGGDKLRAIARKLFHVAKHVAPVLISGGLVCWLVWKTGPRNLAQATASPAMPWLVLATVVQVVVLFLWDSICLWWLFSQPQRPVSYRTLLRARGDATLWSALSLEIGQGMFAWTLADVLESSITEFVARCVVLSLFDFAALQSVALIGSFVHPDPLIRILRWIPAGAVSGLIVLVLMLRYMPERWRRWVESKKWGSWLKWWTWRHSVLLFGLRLAMFLLVLLYAGICLGICRIDANARTVAGVIPFVLIAESLPGTAGMGERETALIYLLRPTPEQRPLLLCFGLTWSVVIMLSRLSIGLISRSLPRHHRQVP